MRERCPLYHRKRTCAAQLDMSALCQKRTSNSFGTKVTRPADANDCFVRIRDCELIHTPGLVLGSVLPDNFIPEFVGPNDTVGLALFRRSLNALLSNGETLGSIEIVARQDRDNGARFHFAPTLSVIALQSSVSLKLGDLRAWGNVRFGSKADMCSARRHVRLVPKADIANLIESLRQRERPLFLEM